MLARPGRLAGSPAGSPRSHLNTNMLAFARVNDKLALKRHVGALVGTG
jgi:hypothetical protein